MVTSTRSAPIHAVFFDLDDTLLETHHAHAEALWASCEAAAARPAGWTVEQLADAFTRSYHRIEEQMETGTVHFDSHLLLRTRTWEETLRACGLAPELGEELAQVYLTERRRRYRLYDEVPPLLDRIAARYTLVLVTNGLSDLQREKVTAVALGRWFQHIAVSSEQRSWKPDPGIFRHALELAGTGPEHAVMVGDALERDVLGAASLGIRTVWVRRYPHLQPVEGIRPDAEVEDLTGLEELLSDWGGRQPA